MKDPKPAKAADTTVLRHQAEKYRPKLESFIRKWISNKQDIEDIVQDVFYQLFRTLDMNLCQIENLSSWLYRVARNMVINKGKRKTEEEYPLSLHGDDGFLQTDFPADLFDSRNPDPETVYLRSLVWHELETALSELPAEQRAVFELTEFEGLTMKEVASVTGASINTLLSRKHYAVLHLRSRLKSLYNDILEY